ncbi:Anti-sigma regulatory factor (Ser/Thr protein kinase) [Mariprofundus aestuarium]|uniref:Anti-sigma regulatory factor (Ser/Thr protein kinase) n=1 Tax=Mariprofundus aestuarium TaxID=1921086 RepID=A0A2K8L2R3_MARES|nr:ATP-binding protein [Mariprofundus aestuarium]ATX78526.1 Anti-sigma regulatory factor (Ser/Thr protein kinase) [Mariprofundus aestuarium]
MPQPETRSFYISGPADVTAARRVSKSFALALSFDEVASEQMALVASELGSNIYKHAGRGTLSLSSITVEAQHGMVIEARDWGGGIANQEEAFADGFSTAGTLGDGLGAVNRLVDSMEITSDGENGTHIIGIKMLRKNSFPMPAHENPFDIAAVSRAIPGHQVNGDAFVIKHANHRTLVAVIDGVGHGTFAHKASTTAKAYIESHFEQDLEHLLMGCSRACRATRGAVMTLVALEWQERNMHYAGIGNIESRIFNALTDKKLIVRRGIVGNRMPPPKSSLESWNSGAVMVLHSDGISTKWQWHELTPVMHLGASAVAQRIMERYGKGNDDATVLVIMDKAEKPHD